MHTQIKEEKCGIKKAIEEGKISPERYERFCKIYEQLKRKGEKKMVEVSTSILSVQNTKRSGNIFSIRKSKNRLFPYRCNGRKICRKKHI